MVSFTTLSQRSYVLNPNRGLMRPKPYLFSAASKNSSAKFTVPFSMSDIHWESQFLRKKLTEIDNNVLLL